MFSRTPSSPIILIFGYSLESEATIHLCADRSASVCKSLIPCGWMEINAVLVVAIREILKKCNSYLINNS